MKREQGYLVPGILIAKGGDLCMTPEELTTLEQAKRTRYLAKGPENGAETIQAFWQWCTEQGQPCVSVEEKSGSVTLIFDTGTVWEHFLPRFQWLQEKPFFFTLDPTEELQQQVRQVINASGFQGGAGYGGSYTWIRGLPLEQAEPTVQALLRIWEQARSVHLSTLGKDEA